MRLIRRIAQFNPIGLLKPGRRQGQCCASDDTGECLEKSNNNLSLENIRDLIIEAYGCVDKKRRIGLLEKAARLEKSLVTVYRSRGLEITADNIAKTLKILRQRQRKRSS